MAGGRKTTKKSSYHGVFYHIRLTMIVLFRAYLLHLQGKLPHFELKTEDATAGKFDDVVLRYSSPSTSQGTVFIQAKHKIPPETTIPKKAKKMHPDHPYTPTQRERPAITQGTLLTKWSSNGPFSIPMYFISYLEQYQRRSAGSHTYLVCTNATIDGKLKKTLTLRNPDASDILSFCNDIRATCYSFNEGKELRALFDQLRQASIEKLGQMLILHVKFNREIQTNYSTLNVYSDLIADCVEECEPGKFKLSQKFLTADQLTVMGKLRTALQHEYNRLIKAKQGESCGKWEEMQFKIEKSFFQQVSHAPHTPISDESLYYEKIDQVIRTFYKEFMLVCGSLNEEELYNKILEIMPHWVSHKNMTHHVLFERLFNTMTLTRPVPIDAQSFKQQIIDMKMNFWFDKFQVSSWYYQKLWLRDYKHVTLRTDPLQHTELYEFLTDESVYESYRYCEISDMRMFFLIAYHTVTLFKCKALFVHYADPYFQGEILEVLQKLLEFIDDVDPSFRKIIISIDKSKNTVLPDLQRLAKTHKAKLIVIEEVFEAKDSEEDHLYLRDLTEECRQKFLAERCKQTLNLFRTTVSLREIVKDEDNLSFICDFWNNPLKSAIPTGKNRIEFFFKAITAWYIPRTVVPYEEGETKVNEKENFICHIQFKPIISFDNVLFQSVNVVSLLKSIVSSNREDHLSIPDAFKDHEKENVHIVIDEAGTGKSTFFTWLAYCLSLEDRSYYVIRLNASQYVTDYKRGQAHALPSDDTAIVRMLYRLIHLNLTVSNVYSQSIKKTDVERNLADRAAMLLTLSNDQIIVNLDKMKALKVPLQQVIELKIFQEKFNKRKLIILLDGLDEAAPHYKNFVMRYFGRVAGLRGIQRFFLSTRPYDYKEELEHHFPNSKMYRLKLFSQREQLRVIHNYLMDELPDYMHCNDSNRIPILGLQHIKIEQILGDLVPIPLFLHMACVVHLSLITLHIDFENQTISKEFITQTNVELLTVIEGFINEKLEILSLDKTGETRKSLEFEEQKRIHERWIKILKRRHVYFAMLVLFETHERETLLTSIERSETKEMLRKITIGFEKTGIITGIHEDIPQFTHRIFAEYFASVWLHENKERIRSNAFFLSLSYWNDTFNRMRDFFNRLILRESKGCVLHMAVVNQSETLVHRILSNNPAAAFVKDAVGRLPLHLAVTYPSTYNVKMLIDKMSLQFINSVDDLFGWSALDYAFAKRYESPTKQLLAAGATINEHILLQQILSNNLWAMLHGSNFFGKYLQSNENSKSIANRLHIRVVDHLLNEQHVDIVSPQNELESLSVLKFCVKENIAGILKHILLQTKNSTVIPAEEYNRLLELAFESNAHDIIVYFMEDLNISLPQINNVAGLISALKHIIQKKHVNSFKDIFHQLCLIQNIPLVENVDMIHNNDLPDHDKIPFLDKKLHPKVCCVRSSSNVRLSLPEHNPNDILHEGFVIEALLATAVHEGNMAMLRYMLHKTNTPVTNRIIITIMRLLPKDTDVCHEKSMPAFLYLLDNSTDLDSVDDEGRNLIHMTAQNGCFFMLHCLIAKRFDPASTNLKNGWNVFHYVVLYQNDDRSDKVLEYFLKQCNMVWFDMLDNMLDSELQETEDASNAVERNQNTTYVKKLSKCQHGLLAWFVLLDKKDVVKLLSDQEQQEASKCLKLIAENSQVSVIIKGVENDIPQFTHRIFAEYMAACWVNNNKERMRNEVFFRSWSYWHSKLHRMRDLFNRIIARESKGCDLHMAVIKQSEEQVREMLSNNPSAAFVKDAVGRLPLHLAVINPSEDIVKIMIDKMSLQFINSVDDLFGWSALDYAFVNHFELKIQDLLSAGATVNEHMLLQQILSNNLYLLLHGANFYGEYLLCNENSKPIANRLHIRVVYHLLNEQHVDIVSPQNELHSLSVLEFCVKAKMKRIVKHFLSQANKSTVIPVKEYNRLLKLAFESNAHDIIVYFMEDLNISLPQINNVAVLISALKHIIQKKHVNSFKDIFHQLCLIQNIPLVENVDMIHNNDLPDHDKIPSLDKKLHPKVCCVRSSSNVRLSLPEHNPNDILHEGFVIEALLATAVHEGNMAILRYMLHKTNTPVTNRIIITIMRLLPKDTDVCHEKSMPAFLYLLDNSTDLDSVDDEGRNLIHMTAQNGCFFMLHCLIAKRFDPASTNLKNGWNVFHYVVLYQNDDRSDKVLEYFLKQCNMVWFDMLDNMLDSELQETEDASNAVERNQNTTNVEKLSKRQHGLLAWFVLLDKKDVVKLLPDQEQQEASQCLKLIAENSQVSVIIKGVENDTPQFTHRIFAEYMAACWVNNNKERMRNEVFFRSWSYWHSKLHRMRDLFNRIIARESKGCDLHMAVINQSVEQVREMLSINLSAAFVKDAVGRLPLHLAVSYPSEDIVNMLIDKMSLQFINSVDNLFGWSALDYAFASRYEFIIKKLLSAGATVNEHILLQQILSNNLCSLLHSANDYGEWLQTNENSKPIANRLCNRVVDHLLNEKRLDIVSPQFELDSLSTLEYCKNKNMMEILKQLENDGSNHDFFEI